MLKQYIQTIIYYQQFHLFKLFFLYIKVSFLYRNRHLIISIPQSYPKHQKIKHRSGSRAKWKCGFDHGNDKRYQQQIIANIEIIVIVGFYRFHNGINQNIQIQQ